MFVKNSSQPRRNNPFSRGMFYIIRALIRLFYGKVTVEGLENLPERDAILVANHCQMHGPIVGELFLPRSVYIWCAGSMMHAREVPRYAFTDFWSQKPAWTHPFYKALAVLITPLSVCLFNNARTVAVYRDARIVSTFKETVRLMKEGKNILVFPERDEVNNNILYAFEENFVDVARLYQRRFGRSPVFVPVYIAPDLKTAYIGKGTPFDPAAEPAAERHRICTFLTDAITETARALPAHWVIPYRNIPKKNYLTNKDFWEVPHA